MKENNLWEFLKSIVIALIIVIPIRAWVAQPFIVRGESMLPTFENGEYLIIDEVSYRFRSPGRGEVVVFRAPLTPSQFYIKRIVGLPGDTVRIQDGNVFVNDTPLEESYLYPDIATAPEGEFSLKENEYFVLGDNRERSSDSRFWGGLQKKSIIGHTFLRLWPLTKIGFL